MATSESGDYTAAQQPHPLHNSSPRLNRWFHKTSNTNAIPICPMAPPTDSMTSESPENEDLAALLANTMLLEEKLKCGETMEHFPETCDDEVHDSLPPAKGFPRMLAGIKKLTGYGSLRPASGIDLRHSTFTDVAGDMHNYYHTFVYEKGPTNWQPLPSLSFNEAQNRLSPHFIGREEEIKRIGNALSVACNDAPTRYAIYGRAGLGKTQLASKYAELSYRQRYSVVIWISGATVENLNQGFANILTLIGHPDHGRSEHTQSARLALVRRWLEESGSIKWLLILDNIAQEAVGFLREHLPRKNSSGNILLTTRAALVAEALAGRQHQVLELHDPEPRDAAKQLLAEAEIDSNMSMQLSMSKAEDMVKFVGKLPLVISQVASLVKHFHHSLDEVLSIYQDQGKYELLSWENKLSNYEQKSFMVTFTTLLQELDRKSPDSGNLLRVLSCFDPENISLDMINDGAKDLQLLSASDSKSPQLKSLITLLHCPTQLQWAIEPLLLLSLVRCESTQGRSTLRIHDETKYMIQEITWRLRDDCWFQVTVGLVYGAFKHIGDPASHKCWAQCETLSPHILSLSKLNHRHTMVDSRLNQMNVGLGHYLTSRGRYSEAEALFQQAQASAAELYGPEHTNTLRIGEELAKVYWELGRYTEAHVLLHQILTSREKDPGTSLDTLTTVHNLARTYHLQGQYKEAEMLFAKALAGREKALGSDNSDTLQTMHYMAITYRDLGWYSKAERLFGQALTGREKILGLEHHDTLKTMTLLPTVYSVQGQCDEAEKMFVRTLAIKEKVLGPDHPSTLVTIHCQAINKRSQHQYDEAEKLFAKVLGGRECSWT